MGQIEINHTGSGGGVVLSSDGTDLLLGGSAVGGGGGASANGTLLQTITISSNTSNIDIGSSSLFTTAYTHYRVTGLGMKLATSDPYLKVRLRRGSTWDTTSNYNYNFQRNEASAQTLTGGGNSSFYFSQYQYATAGYTGTYILDFFNVASTANETMVYAKTLQNNGTTASMCYGAGRYPHVDAVTGIRLFRHIYAFSGGVVKLYGVE